MVDTILDIALGLGLLWFLVSAFMRGRRAKPRNLAIYFDSSDIASAQRRKYRPK